LSDQAQTGLPEPPAELVRAQLERILASAPFTNSQNLSRLLRYVVLETLDGRGDSLKEYVLGVQVFGRGQSFDPRLDPIVRVQARNLRARLTDYYQSAGQSDPVHIDLPKGTYVPVFSAPRAATKPSRPTRRWIWPAAAAVLIACALGAGLLLSRNSTGAAAHGAVPSIAVVPFVDLSADHSQEYFSDGLTDEIIDALTRVGGLRVAARTSSFTYKGRSRDAREVGRALKVATVLTGSVRKEGDRVRIVAQLVDVASGYYLWSNSFERQMRGVLSVQEEISQSIVDTLSVKLARGGADHPLRARTGNSEAYNLYLRGRYLYNKQNKISLLKSVEYFGRAVERDSSYAAAYAGLGDAYNLLVQYGYLPPTEGMPKAKEAALIALRLDPGLAEAHVTLATILEAYDWDWAAAEREYRRAIELNPQHGPARLWYGLFLWDQGRTKEAMAEVRRAYQLDPLSILASTYMGKVYAAEGDYEAALDQFRKVLELDPLQARVYVKLGLAYRKLERFDQASDALERARKLSGDDPHTLALLAHTYALQGRRKAARRILDELDALSRRRYVSAFDRACVEARLGNSDRALSLLEQAYRERSSGLVCVRQNFESLRSSPRFAALVNKMHFTG